VRVRSQRVHRYEAAAVLGVVLAVVLLVAAATLAGCSQSPVTASASAATAPDFSGTTLTGAQVSLSGYRGKTLVLNFMASWCGPCRAEAPEIDAFYRENKDKVAVLAMAVEDTENDIRALMSGNGFTFPVVPYGTNVAEAYGVTAVPTTFVIDPEGHIVQRLVGGTTAAKLSAAIDAITP